MTDFDRTIARRGSRSYKWDGGGALFGRADLLPFWVADMDFAAPAAVLEALRQRLEHPVFGYETRDDGLTGAIVDWLSRRHGWQVPEEWLAFCPPSAIVGMYGMVTRLTGPGAGVVCLTPGYGPLFRIVEDSGRRLVRCPLAEREGRFRLDMDGLRRGIDGGVEMLLLCNPHNPTGRVFTREELHAVAELALECNLFVVSDEVHCDLVMPGYTHIPFGSLGVTRSVTVISPNKTFNTAGLPQSTFVIPDAEIRSVFAGFLDTLQINHESTFGAVAAEAAYLYGGPWLDELIEYLDGNQRLLRAFLAERVPAVRAAPAEGTYLAWLDCRRTGFSETELMRRLIEDGGVGLYAGTSFGEEGAGFLRMNLACPRETLRRGLEGIARALPSPPL